MADDGGSGGVQRGPELLGRRRSTKGIEGGAVEERTRHTGVDKRDGAKSGTGGGRRLLWRPGGAAEGKGRGSGVKGGYIYGASSVSMCCKQKAYIWCFMESSTKL
jgi:hypothetical protein